MDQIECSVDTRERVIALEQLYIIERRAVLGRFSQHRIGNIDSYYLIASRRQRDQHPSHSAPIVQRPPRPKARIQVSGDNPKQLRDVALAGLKELPQTPSVEFRAVVPARTGYRTIGLSLAE